MGLSLTYLAKKPFYLLNIEKKGAISLFCKAMIYSVVH